LPGLNPINKNSQIWEILQKMSENFKPTIYVRKRQENYLTDVLVWLAH
jgi:hypothetical protein